TLDFNQRRKLVEIDIAAAHNHTDFLSGQLRTLLQSSSEGDCARRFDKRVQTLNERTHRDTNLFITHQDDVLGSKLTFQNRESNVSQRGKQTISDGIDPII